MALTRIRVSDLRIIEEADFQPGSGLNLICGPNGSGKTSLLEAIYLLGRGRSFRSARIQSVIRETKKCVEVVGWKQGTTETIAGIRRCSSDSEIKINGERITKLSSLARLFPVQVMTPKSHELLERGPELRRRFIDWGVFHVEHGYQAVSSRYQRVLRQRNEALRKTPGQEGIWDSQFIELSDALTRMRERYIPLLRLALDEILCRLSFHADVVVGLNQGWATGKPLKMVLDEHRVLDRKQGFTGAGPHRADLTIRVGRRSAAERLSRGQQKLLVFALSVAELEVVAQASGERPLLLVDDLAAELDHDARRRVLDLLGAQPGQVFITALDDSLVAELLPSAVFHVEQGALSS